MALSSLYIMQIVSEEGIQKRIRTNTGCESLLNSLGLVLFSVALWCYVSPPPLRVTSWSYLSLGSKTTERQGSTWRDNSQQFRGGARTHTRALTCTRVCNSIVLTSWQKAYTSGFPRQQVCKISNILSYVHVCGHSENIKNIHGQEKRVKLLQMRIK